MPRRFLPHVQCGRNKFPVEPNSESVSRKQRILSAETAKRQSWNRDQGKIIIAAMVGWVERKRTHRPRDGFCNSLYELSQGRSSGIGGQPRCVSVTLIVRCCEGFRAPAGRSVPAARRPAPEERQRTKSRTDNYRNPGRLLCASVSGTYMYPPDVTPLGASLIAEAGLLSGFEPAMSTS